MGDKIVESVVEKAIALQDLAIEAARQRVISEISPKIKKLFNESIEEESKKVLEQAEKPESPPNPDQFENGEAEIDLDDLAKELESGDEESEEVVEDDEEEAGADAESIEDKVAKLEDDVSEIKDDVDELKGEESTEQSDSGGEESAELKPESEDTEELGESVNINVDGDEEINIDVSKSGESVVDFAPLPTEDAGDEEEDMEEVKEARRRRIAEAVKKMKMKKLRERIARRKAMKEQADVEKDTDVLIDIIDDTNMDDETTPDKEDWDKTRPKFEESKNIVMLKRRAAIAERKLMHERTQMLKARKVMSETALLNKKLILASRIFAEYNLSKNGKVNVLNEFDKATTIKESIDVYNKIVKALSKKATPKVAVNESKVVNKTEKKVETKPELKEPKPEESGDVLLEVARPTGALPQDRVLDMDRLQQLAGIRRG